MHGAKSADFPPFAPRVPWLGGDLQTLRNWFRQGDWPDLETWPGERLRFPLPDGDTLLAMLHRPDDAAGRPLLMLIHGLTGCEDSAYIRYTADLWLRRGHPVLRFNMRGSGPSRPLCRSQYHSGRTEDLRAVLSAIDASLVGEGVLLVGYSLGGNMMLKYLGEEGAAAPVLAAASISAPIDLARSSRRMLDRRNRVYTRWFIGNLKAETLANASLTDAERRGVMAARTVLEFDEAFIAPRNGYADAAEYYADCSALRFLSAVRAPTLVIHATNDPWIPADTYRAVDWPANSMLTPLIDAAGGHVGFHGRGSRTAWHDRCVERFFAAVTGSRR